MNEKTDRQRGAYLSAFLTTLASSLEVDAAFTSLFLFSSEVSQVLL